MAAEIDTAVDKLVNAFLEFETPSAIWRSFFVVSDESILKTSLVGIRVVSLTCWQMNLLGMRVTVEHEFKHADSEGVP